MQIRRCAVVWLEPLEVARFELADLLRGGPGVVSRLTWHAHAPHLAQPLELDVAAVGVLGALGPVDWVPLEEFVATHGAVIVDLLLEQGMLIKDEARHEASTSNTSANSDERLRSVHWHPAAAVAHMASCWHAVDGPSGMADAGVDTNEGLLQRHGLPPAVFKAVAEGVETLELPRVAHDDFDALLDSRTTCRNYDTEAHVPLAAFSQLMARVFGARGIGHAAPKFDVIKRTTPSGGALHPTECYLIVQRVEGIVPGLYRYCVDTHSLEPVEPRVSAPRAGDTGVHALGAGVNRAWSAGEVRAFARITVAGQEWFADAPVLCVLAPRFQRNFWKYRNHAKAYRVAVLDVGHLSQTLQLCATQAGLGPFITSAINEVDIERAFGLIGVEEGPLAVCGFGIRAKALSMSEFDPNRRIWPRD